MSLEQDFEELMRHAERKFEELSLKTQQERELEKAMSARFKKNIAAFKYYLPEIAAEFTSYYSSDVDLFCTSTGHANIIDDVTGHALYSDDPIKQCQEQVEYNIKNPLYTSLAFDRNKDVKIDFLHTQTMGRMYGRFLEAAEEHDKLDHIPDHLGAMVMFGVGLGYHLEYLLEKISIEHIYICEPNQTLFFASLYTCDWDAILTKIDKDDGYIYLQVGVNYEQFTQDFVNEMAHRGHFNAVNSVIYRHYPSQKLTNVINKLSQDFHLVASGWGFFDDGLISISHDYQNLVKNMPLFRKGVTIPKRLENIPVFVVANGPSLDIAFDAIKEYQHDAIVISCGSAINSLLKNGILPDFHIATERTRFTYDYYKEFIDPDVLKKINLLTMSIMHPMVPDLFGWTGMTFKPNEPSTIIYFDYIDRGETYVQMRYCNPQVANTALAYCSYMNIKDVYLFGTDCGYKDRDHHHSKSSLYYTDTGEEKDKLGTLIKTGELVVDGNFGGKVYSTAFMDSARFYLEKLCMVSPHMTVYNCSDGAKIGYTFPTRVDNLLIFQDQPDKAELIDFIKSEFFLVRSESKEEFEKWLDFDAFDDMADTLIEFVENRFESRKDAARSLTKQIRYLFSFAYTRYRHIYFMLHGSLTYFHSVFRMTLYGFNDPEVALDILYEQQVMFCEFLQEAKVKYRNVLNDSYDNDSYLMGMFKDDSVPKM